MNKISSKQSRIDRTLNQIKKDLVEESRVCRCCYSALGTDLAHLLPRSTFPEYQTKKWNLTLLCRGCHVRYDGDKKFRANTELGSHIKQIDILAYNRYYG